MAHATKTSESSLRAIVLVMTLAALLFPVAAWADTMVTLNAGMLTLQVSFGTSNDSRLTAIGPDFALNAGSGPFGFTGPHCDPCVPGSSFGIGTSVFGATTGGLTYAGVSYGVNDAPVPNAAFVSWTAGALGSRCHQSAQPSPRPSRFPSRFRPGFPSVKITLVFQVRSTALPLQAEVPPPLLSRRIPFPLALVGCCRAGPM